MKTTLLAATFLAFASLSASAVVSAADKASSDKNSGAQARYEQDRKACMSGTSNQDRATCLKEAGAALEESKRGQLKTESAEHDKNKFSRCDPLPKGQREDCIRRMNGEGTVSGSVQGGGIYRELVTPVTKQ